MTTNGNECQVRYKTSDGYIFDSYSEAVHHATTENRRTTAGCTIEEEREIYFYGLSMQKESH